MSDENALCTLEKYQKMSHVCIMPYLRVGHCVQTNDSLVRGRLGKTDYILISQILRLWSISDTAIKIPLKTCFISYLGRMIFSLGSSEAKSLKVLNLTGGGWRKGLAPKLNSHCWYDIKLAAAKKPDLTDIEVRERKGFIWEKTVGQKKEERDRKREDGSRN